MKMEVSFQLRELLEKEVFNGFDIVAASRGVVFEISGNPDVDISETLNAFSSIEDQTCHIELITYGKFNRPRRGFLIDHDGGLTDVSDSFEFVQGTAEADQASNEVMATFGDMFQEIRHEILELIDSE